MDTFCNLHLLSLKIAEGQVSQLWGHLIISVKSEGSTKILVTATLREEPEFEVAVSQPLALTSSSRGRARDGSSTFAG